MTNESRFQRWSIFGCAAIAVASMVLSVVFVTALTRQINQIKAYRADAQFATCQAYNTDLAKNVNALNDRTQSLMRAAFAPNPARPKATQDLVDRFVRDQSLQFDTIKIQLRDCSPHGLAAFYERGH